MRAKLIPTLALVISLGRLTAIQAQAVVQKPVQPKEFVVGPSYVRIPVNVFILVRNGKQLGAIKFSKIEIDGNNNGESNYESYFQGDGSGSLAKPNVVKRIGEIEIKPMRGTHAFAWQPGANKLWVGHWWFGCLSPNLVNMSEHFSEVNKGYEFAPTSAENVNEIDASDKRLKWYPYDSDTSHRLDASALPK